MEPIPIPSGFIDLTDASARLDHKTNCVIGVCVDFLPTTATGGSDWTSTFTLHDLSWMNGLGMKFRWFHKDRKGLPDIQHQGDVIFIRNFKTTIFNGVNFGLSHWGSSWLVVPHAALSGNDNLATVLSKVRGPAGFQRLKSLTDPELRYAKFILENDDPSRWPRLQGTTVLQRNEIMQSSGGLPSAVNHKFKVLANIPKLSASDRIFVELLGEVRKKFHHENRTELYITDYTAHQQLYEYPYDDSENEKSEGAKGVAGDPYGYTNMRSRYTSTETAKWPGPWGRMTLTVVLWPPHHEFAIQHIGEGDYVYLQNLKVEYDKDGRQLEGKVHGDQRYPEKVLIERWPPHVHDDDERMRSLIERKRQYEEKSRAENKPFLRNATIKKREADALTDKAPGVPKSKKAKTRNQRKQENRKAKDQGNNKPNASDTNSLSNAIVRCKDINIPPKTIEDILDPSILERRSANGNMFKVPFQNCKYKCKVRVVDFFPDNIADFAVSRSVCDYDILSDREDSQRRWEERSLSLHEGGELVQWEWQFVLLVEDTRTPLTKDREAARMELLVAGQDAEFLLNLRDDACDLRDEGNEHTLARLKEKLFHLWGDLQERKEEASENRRPLLKTSSRPFECLIKEYGVPMRGPSLQEKEATNAIQYERMFRLFDTTIKS